MHLSGIFIYPVKSLRGIAVPTAQLDALGLRHDRRFLVVDHQGQFLTQRALPRMALIETVLASDALILRTPDDGSARVSLSGSGNIISVQIWRDNVSAEDCGPEVSAWLSDFLGHPCRLVRIGPTFTRRVAKQKAKLDDHFHFADGAPVLAIGAASLSDLNDRLQERGEAPVPMDRFRPNLVVNGGLPFAEDNWERCQIGEVIFRSAGPCARCIITTTDQQTAQRGKEPLRTLATYRHDAENTGNINFGQNLINESKQGIVKIGDKIELL